MSDVESKFEGSVFEVNFDDNNDGQSSAKVKVHMSEALEEIIGRGDAAEGVKVVDFKIEGAKLILKVDTDKDGQSVLELEVDMLEVFDEASAKFKK